jgi:hypothetical protein
MSEPIMPAGAIASAATIVALFDNAETAGLASGAVKARVPGATVHRIDPTGAEAAMLEASWLPPETVDPYLASLGEGRTLVAVEADRAEAAAIDAILREYGPAEAMIHGKDEDNALPPSVRSTAAETGRPHGHRDPSA